MSTTQTPPTQTEPTDEPARSSTTPPPSAERAGYATYLVVLLVVAAAVFVAVGWGNRALNPYVYDGQAIAEAGRGHAAGQSFANYDANVDLRALRKAQIEAMTETPDVIVFGGSRWQEARAEHVPGQRLFNAFVSNDQIEDMMALAYILEENNRLPKTMIYSLRFVSLQPVAERHTYDWKNWGPEYAAMATKLGLPVHPIWERLPVQTWSGMFSLPDLFARTDQLSLAEDSPRLTGELQTDELDIIAPDGSLRFSKANEATFTKPNVDKLVKRELKRQGPTAPKVDPVLTDQFGVLIDYLRGKGVTVIVAQTPYHPDFWKGIQNQPFLGSLKNLEATAQKMQREHGAIAAGHYDPAFYPVCTAAQFIDHIHGRAPCLAQVFESIPGMAQKG